MSKRKKTDKTTPASAKEKRALAREMLLKEPALSNRLIAKSIKMSHTTVAKIRAELVDSGHFGHTPRDSRWLEHPYLKLHPELLDNLNVRFLRALRGEDVLDKMQERNILNPVYAQRLVHHDRKRAAEAVYAPLTANDIILRCDDLTYGLRWIKDESVDCIITDPPYAGEYVSLYKTIAEIASRVLKPQGLLIIMTGQTALNKIFRAIDEVPGIVYLWTAAYLTTAGGSTYLNQFSVTPYWKPILIYIKGIRQYKDRGVFSDVIDSAPDKTRQTLHYWQQDIDGMKKIVHRFTKPGDIVLDPCTGASTTGAACVELKRKYIGVDIDPESVRVSRDRLLAMLTNPTPPPE